MEISQAELNAFLAENEYNIRRELANKEPSLNYPAIRNALLQAAYNLGNHNSFGGAGYPYCDDFDDLDNLQIVMKYASMGRDFSKMLEAINKSSNLKQEWERFMILMRMFEGENNVEEE